MFIIWAFLFSGNEDPRLWHAFLINFLFFTSAAAGLVVWPAIVIAAYGNWMGNVEKFCWTGLSFSIPSLVALIILWVGSESWVPWVINYNGEKFWLNNTFLFSRNLVAQIVFWFMAFLFVKNRYSSNYRIYANLLIIIYAIAFSLMGFDFVMALEPQWYSMMIGGYFFITGVYTAAAVWAFMTVISGNKEKDKLHDIGKLIIAFCMFSSYLMFSHLFPIWYENNPREVLFLLPRMNYEWKWISYLLLFLIYLGPIVFLLPARSKRNPVILGIISALIIVGMWIERWWLVSAVFERQKILFGWIEVIPTIGFLTLSVAGILVFKRIIPQYVKPEKIEQ